MFDKNILPEGLVITEEDLANTPPPVLKLLLHLIERITQQEERIAQQEKRIEELEAKLGMNSSNSSKPPSTDSPYKEKKTGRKPKQRKTRKGYRQELLPPTKANNILPGPCTCGCKAA